MKFDWYTIIKKSSKITQGDIINSCYIPLPNKEIYDSIINNETNENVSLNIKQADVIIMSQACDIENEKVDSIVACPLWSLKILIENNQYFKSSSSRESLRQGREPAYHLLNKCNLEEINFPYSVVDFHRIYSLPKSFLELAALKLNKRLRVLPPYREYLSQAFARYFMRVGLPLDISKDDIKNFI